MPEASTAALTRTARSSASAEKGAEKRGATRRAATKKASAKKASTTKTSTKARAHQPAAKKPAAKTAATKTAATKSAAGKIAAKRSAAKKTAERKAIPTKATSSKAATKKTTASKTTKKAAPSTRRTTSSSRATRVRLPVRTGEDPWTKSEVAEVRADLGLDRDRLLGEVAHAERGIAVLLRDGGDGAGNDQADVGSNALERDSEMSLANNSREMLFQVERALSRLEDGSYGVCESCGEPIGKLRLMAFPRATLCVSCKQRQERR